MWIPSSSLGIRACRAPLAAGRKVRQTQDSFVWGAGHHLSGSYTSKKTLQWNIAEGNCSWAEGPAWWASKAGNWALTTALPGVAPSYRRHGHLKARFGIRGLIHIALIRSSLQYKFSRASQTELKLLSAGWYLPWDLLILLRQETWWE